MVEEEAKEEEKEKLLVARCLIQTTQTSTVGKSKGWRRWRKKKS